MNEWKAMPMYEDGARKCPLCGDDLPKHQVWPGAHYRYCMKPACKTALLAMEKKGWHYIEAGKRRCDAEGCANAVREGRYSNNSRFKTCSADCYYQCVNAGRRARHCACGCGLEVRRLRWDSIEGPVFVSHAHRRTYLIDQYLSSVSGTLRPVVDEFFEGFASNHFRRLGNARSGLGPFLRFLNESGIGSLEAVTPRTITNFVIWMRSAECGPPKMSYIHTFFEWAIRMGHREQANPVIGSIHNPKRTKGSPRPYTKEEVAFAWKLLDERGGARARFAVAIAEESGLRLGEICRIRVGDVDPVSQRCFIRLPNKTMTERIALFGDKTKRCFDAWMKERDPGCTHNYLLHDTRRNPCSERMMLEELNRTLCKSFRGRHLNETGFQRWETHRLRHTMASNLVSGGAEMRTVMALGGWKSYDAAAGYAAPNPLVARRGYDEAMHRLRERRNASSRTKILTPEALLTRGAMRTVKRELGLRAADSHSGSPYSPTGDSSNEAFGSKEQSQ